MFSTPTRPQFTGPQMTCATSGHLLEFIPAGRAASPFVLYATALSLSDRQHIGLQQTITHLIYSRGCLSKAEGRTVAFEFQIHSHNVLWTSEYNSLNAPQAGKPLARRHFNIRSGCSRSSQASVERAFCSFYASGRLDFLKSNQIHGDTVACNS